MTGEPSASHGAYSRYLSGCRCEECRTAQREYQRRYLARRRTEDPSSPEWPLTHGGRASYNAGCRCDECRAANARHGARERQRETRKPDPAKCGTEGNYARGCRCPRCRAEQSVRQRERVAARKERYQREGFPQSVHGTRNGYGLGCRCDRCRAAEATRWSTDPARQRSRWRAGYRDAAARAAHVEETRRRREEIAARALPPELRSRILAAVIGGLRPSQAAERVGVTWQRISAWAVRDAEFSAALDRALIAAAPPETPHGTSSGYRRWRCRCTACHHAHRGVADRGRTSV